MQKITRLPSESGRNLHVIKITCTSLFCRVVLEFTLSMCQKKNLRGESRLQLIYRIGHTKKISWSMDFTFVKMVRASEIFFCQWILVMEQ